MHREWRSMQTTTTVYSLHSQGVHVAIQYMLKPENRNVGTFLGFEYLLYYYLDAAGTWKLLRRFAV